MTVNYSWYFAAFHSGHCLINVFSGFALSIFMTFEVSDPIVEQIDVLAIVGI